MPASLHPLAPRVLLLAVLLCPWTAGAERLDAGDTMILRDHQRDPDPYHKGYRRGYREGFGDGRHDRYGRRGYRQPDYGYGAARSPRAQGAPSYGSDGDRHRNRKEHRGRSDRTTGGSVGSATRERPGSSAPRTAAPRSERHRRDHYRD